MRPSQPGAPWLSSLLIIASITKGRIANSPQSTTHSRILRRHSSRDESTTYLRSLVTLSPCHSSSTLRAAVATAFPTRSHFANRIPSLFQDSNLSETNLPRSQHPHWRRAAFTLCFLLLYLFPTNTQTWPLLLPRSPFLSSLSTLCSLTFVSPTLCLSFTESSSGPQPSLGTFSACSLLVLRTASSLHFASPAST